MGERRQPWPSGKLEVTILHEQAHNLKSAFISEICFTLLPLMVGHVLSSMHSKQKKNYN